MTVNIDCVMSVSVANTCVNSNWVLSEEVTDLTKFPNEKNDLPKLSVQSGGQKATLWLMIDDSMDSLFDNEVPLVSQEVVCNVSAVVVAGHRPEHVTSILLSYTTGAIEGARQISGEQPWLSTAGQCSQQFVFF